MQSLDRKQTVKYAVELVIGLHSSLAMLWGTECTQESRRNSLMAQGESHCSYSWFTDPEVHSQLRTSHADESPRDIPYWTINASFGSQLQASYLLMFSRKHQKRYQVLRSLPLMRETQREFQAPIFGAVQAPLL